MTKIHEFLENFSTAEFDIYPDVKTLTLNNELSQTILILHDNTKGTAADATMP